MLKKTIPSLGWELTTASRTKPSPSHVMRRHGACRRCNRPRGLGQHLLTMGRSWASYQSQGSGSSLLPGQAEPEESPGQGSLKDLVPLSPTWTGALPCYRESILPAPRGAGGRGESAFCQQQGKGSTVFVGFFGGPDLPSSLV